MSQKLLIVAILLLIGFSSIADATLAQDDPQATIAALETRVAELEGTATPTDILGETSIEAFPGLYGVAPDRMPLAETGTVQVVAAASTSEYLPQNLVLIIHNNSDATVYVHGVNATVRDGSGALLGVADGESFVSELGPNQYTLAGVGFPDAVDPSFPISFEIDYSKEPSIDDHPFVALQVIEIAQLASTFAGTVTNQTPDDVRIVSVSVYCLSSEGLPSAESNAWFVSELLVPGDEFSFQTEELVDDMSGDCPYYLAFASGY